jgi:PAS domain S-box-containing protein
VPLTNLPGSSIDVSLLDGGELGALVRAHDWAATPLGPIESWPQSLRTAVGLILLSPVPIVMLWGEDGIMIYNDAYSVFAGGRHPRLLGSKVREGWPEVAAFNDHVMKVGLAGGTLAYRDRELTLYRHGEPEQVWMNLDYSPVLDESGRPGGVIAIVVETTARVLAEQQQAFLAGLGDALRDIADPHVVMATAAELLGRYLGAGRVGYGEVEGDGDEAHVVIERDWHLDDVASIAGRHHLRSYANAFEADFQAGLPNVIHDMEADPRTAGLPAADAHAGLGVRAQIVVPLAKAGRLAALLFVHSPERRHWSPGDVALVHDVAERTWAAAERARAEALLRESEARQALRLALMEGQRETADPDTMMNAAAAGLGRYLGVDRVGFFEMVDEDTLGFGAGWTAGRLPLLAGELPAAAIGTAYLAEVRAGRAMGIRDVRADPLTADSRFGEIGTASLIGAPIIRNGRWRAGLYVNHAEPRRWRPADVALVRDIADLTWDAVERARAVAALRESEDHYRHAVELDPQTTWTSAPDGQLDRVNQRWFEWTGTTGLGSTYADGLHEDDRARTFEVWGRSIRTGEPYDIRHRVKMRDGSYRWMHSRAFPRHDEDGRIVKWYGTTEDIHERHTAEAALRESEERFRSIADSAPALIWMTDRDARITFANRHYEREFGLAPEAVLRDGWRQILHEDDVEGFVATFLDAFNAREPFLAEVRVWDKAGRLRWLRCQGVARFDAAGTFLGYTGANVDITDAKLARDELERLVAARTGELVAQIEERERVEETLRQMQRLEAVGQLTSGVAHDFNNLLTVVLGNIGFVEREIDKARIDGKVRDRLGYMRAAAERGATLTAQLLAFSRRQRLEAKPLDLNATVAGMRDLLQSSMGGAVRLETVLKPGLWPALADPTQIELVILNLAINARDAMEVGGSLAVETGNVTLGPPSRPEEPPPGEYVMVSVSDTGTGMPADVMAKAFEPFFTTKPVGKGSGLGLAQVYGFAKQSGGGVKIDTRLGEGTTVRVFLPRASELRQSAAEIGSAGKSERLDGPPRRVLIVDDDSAVREITAALLTELGCIVVEAGSGSAALDLVERDPDPFDLAVVDFAMPGMNGAETAREITARRPGLPVLFVTGYADLTALREIGEDRVVQKPFRNDELAGKIRRLLGTSAGAGSRVVPLRR